MTAGRFARAVPALLLALAGCAGPVASSPPVTTDCEATALGTHRTLVLPREGAAYGRVQHGPLPLVPREVVLTFDDGPRPETTPQVLHALQAECVQATFFMNGEPQRRHAALARQVQAQGHTVAMHGFRHVNFADLAPSDQRADLQAMREAHRDVLGGEAPAWRFPFLSESAALRERLREERITVMSVDVGIEDWVPGQTPAMLADRLITRLRERGGGIVLLHDAQDQTAAALPLLLRRLKDDGWRVVHLQWAER
ncbi:polysaccharide deacetylase family protein [Aquincola sp. S2]|uniref:Polysaccharide deacetylase family protein n=1 Tax=Pseudaquabacterium terrae TaxID=2732868 RepID=A0ABX2ESN2_9BURK|nr:polysaccharide deacetylase family protein [Aquabacterium terrae]NRF71671.1 polysaccharide deacetylase family protein [Aquabacterium terrae]